MSLPSMNFLYLMVSEIQPGQTISCRPPARPPAHPDTMGENNTPTALKGCGVKNHSKSTLVCLVFRHNSSTHVFRDVILYATFRGCGGCSDDVWFLLVGLSYSMAYTYKVLKKLFFSCTVDFKGYDVKREKY